MTTTQSGKATLLLLLLCPNAEPQDANATELSVYNLSAAQQLHTVGNCCNLLCDEMGNRGIDTSTFSQCFDQDGAAQTHDGTDQNGAAQTHDGTEHDTIWYTWGAVIFLITVGGFGFTFWGVGKDGNFGMNLIVPLARALLSNAPLAVYWYGYASCERGLPWLVHLIYAVSCVLAAAPLSLVGFQGGNTAAKMKVPIFGCEGSALAQFYVYMVTMLHLYDQYGDIMSAVIALSCGWHHAWLMVVVYFYGLILQGTVATMMVGVKGFMGSVFGFSTDGMQYGDAETRKIAATMGIILLLSENIPQAALQFWLAYDKNANAIVYASATLSVVTSVKGFMSGVSFLTKKNEDPAESVMVNKNEALE